MTMLKGNAAGHASLNELISPTPLLLLAPNEPPAPIANLSTYSLNKSASDPARINPQQASTSRQSLDPAADCVHLVLTRFRYASVYQSGSPLAVAWRTQFIIMR